MKQVHTHLTGITNPAGEKVNQETRWVKEQLCGFAVHIPGKTKPKFNYTLPLIGNVCRAAWILTAGFPNPNNSRVRRLECEIRNPNVEQSRLSTRRRKNYITRTSYANAFLTNYILRHSERSPVTSDL